MGYMQMKKKPSTLAAFLLILLAGVMLAGCKDHPVEQEEIIRPVRYQLVERAGDVRGLTYSGVSKSGTEIKLSFRVGGSIRTVEVGVGDRVRQNDLIATLDDVDAKLNKERTAISLAKSQVQAETAEANLRRIRALYESNNVSLREYEDAKERYANADAVYHAEKRSLELLNRELNYYYLKAPMDGIITSRDVSRNENVQPGQVVVVLETGDLIEVQVGIPELSISRIEKGQEVAVQFPTVPGAEFKGLVNEVSYSIDRDSSTYPVTVVLADVSDRIRPGMPANVTFIPDGNENPDTLIVPVNSVAHDSMGTYVYVVTPSGDNLGAVHRKDVVLGSLTPQGFELDSGLEQGDRVVTAGLSKMYDGLKVRFIQ